MKTLPLLLLFSALISLMGCGKENESGKGPRKNSYNSSYCVMYSPTGQCTQYQNYPGSNYVMNGVSLAQVQAENPCILGNTYGGYGGGYGGVSGSSLARQTVTMPVNIGSVVASGDIYVGVTSYGDVAAIIGNGTNRPTFVAYLCPRPVGGQGTLYPQITIGAYTNCRVKYITAANMVFPDGSQANFRAPYPGGSSAGRPFTFCQ